MSNTLLLLILLLSALCAVLSGLAVFSNSRPPDPRLNHVMTEMEEVKGQLAQLQKAVLAMDRKLEKEIKDARGETREVMEKLGEALDRRLKELAG